MQYTSRELRKNKKKYKKMSQEEKLKMSHDFEIINSMDLIDVSKLNSFAINKYINVSKMYAGLGYKGRFLNVLDELNFVADCRKVMQENGYGYVPEDEKYMKYLENKAKFSEKRSDDIQVEDMYVNPEQDLNVSMDKKEKGYDKDWTEEAKFGEKVPEECRLFDVSDPEGLRQYKPATLYKAPVLGGNRLGKIKFTTCVKSSRLGKLFGFAASDQQSAMSLEYTEWVGRMNREKCCSRVRIAVSMKKDDKGKIHYEMPMYGEYDGPDSEKTETEVTPNTAYGILRSMSQYMRENPEGSRLGHFKNTHDFVKSVTGRSYETACIGEDRTKLKSVAKLHNSYNAGSAANKIRSWKLNLAKEQKAKA